MSKLLKIGNSIFFLFGLFWLYFSVYFIFEYFNILYTNLESAVAKILFVIPFLVIFLFHFRKVVGKYAGKLLQFLNKHKFIVLLFVVVFQLMIAITSVRIAEADVSYIFSIATDKEYAHASDYISLNPNNYLLALWMKLNYFLFHKNTVLALSLWNIVFIDVSIYLIYLTNSLCINKKAADFSYFLLILILGFSPQHIYIYSDPINLFFLTASIYLFVLSIKKDFCIRYMIVSALSFSISYALRPTSMIFILAGLIVLFFYWISNRKSFAYKKIFRGILAFLLTFALLTNLFSFSLKHQDFVKYEEGRSRTLLYFIDLGLTYPGNNHAELPKSVLTAVGDERKEAALADISKRLNDYDFTSFTGHLYYKYYWIVNEGMFGWFQERILNENSALDSDWLLKFQSKRFARLVRTYVYVDGKNYHSYARIIQIIWIVISIGIFAYPFFYKESPYQLWMQITVFGAILFLMIFEAGRTRYLIQFLPAIITVSSLGLAGIEKGFKKFQKE